MEFDHSWHPSDPSLYRPVKYQSIHCSITIREALSGLHILLRTRLYFAWFCVLFFFCLPLYPVYRTHLFPRPVHLFFFNVLASCFSQFVIWSGCHFFCVLWPYSLFLLCLCLLAYVDSSFLLGSNERWVVVIIQTRGSAAVFFCVFIHASSAG